MKQLFFFKQLTFAGIAFLFLNGCHKSEHRVEQLIDRDWVFAEIPPTNTRNFSGSQENHTVFDGSETVTFSKNKSFFVNGKHYGTWDYDRKTEIITIVQSASDAYSCCTGSSGCIGGQTLMQWELIELSKDRLHVKHPYSVFTETEYIFKDK